MNLTKEKALELHRQMWTDMQEELGDTPDYEEREKFKRKWCREHFHGRIIRNRCFLCQYATEEYRRRSKYINMCKTCCPIDWGKVGLTDCCDDIDSGGQFYYYAPLDKIISVPARVERFACDVAVDDWLIERDPDYASKYILQQISKQLADGIAPHMKIETETDLRTRQRRVRASIGIVLPADGVSSFWTR